MLPGEELLGIYQNSDADAQANLVFTTRGVYRFAESWLCLEYSQIVHMDIVRAEPFVKQMADTLIFHDHEGQEIRLPISGAVIRVLSGNERRFPDIYEVYRFLSRVLGRTRKDQS